jgi:hypothetical protein
MRRLQHSRALTRVRRHLVWTGCHWDPHSDTWDCPSCHLGRVGLRLDPDRRVRLAPQGCACEIEAMLDALGLGWFDLVGEREAS